MLANVVLQAFNPVVADHEPELQRAEPPSQLYVPVAVVNHRSRLRGLIPQILRQNAQGLNQRLSIGYPEAAAIKVRAHPFMRVEIVAVGQVDAVLKMTKLETDHRSPRHGGVELAPLVILLAYLSNRSSGIHRVG